MALEGPSGAGKSTVADRVGTELGCPVMRMDDLYPGWDGLAAVVPLVRAWVIDPLLRGGHPRWRAYDWDRGRHAEEWQETPTGPFLLIEGCGTGARELRPYLSVLAWVDAPADVRAQRLAQRGDAALYAPYREMWARQEDAFCAEHRPREHADLIIENTAAGRL
nr:(d)CMP kinase [Nocardiopsis mwathae]